MEVADGGKAGGLVGKLGEGEWGTGRQESKDWLESGVEGPRGFPSTR